MNDFDYIIKRVELLLGDTYNIKYTYNPWAECYTIKVTRIVYGRDFHMMMNIYKQDLDIDIEMHIMSSFIAQRIISEFSDIIHDHEKGVE